MATFDAIGQEAIKAGFLTTFVRGIMAGWLIALMVWMLPGASTGRIAVSSVMVFLVGIGGLARMAVAGND